MLRSPTVEIRLTDVKAELLEAAFREFAESAGYVFEAGGAIEPEKLGWAYSIVGEKIRALVYRLMPSDYGVIFEKRMAISASEVRTVADSIALNFDALEGVSATVKLNP